jgi:hypothetical protein
VGSGLIFASFTLTFCFLRTIEWGRGSKGDRVRAEVLGQTLPFSISEIEEACPGVSRDMVRLVLRAMKSEGLIESTGKGRGAKWLRINQGCEK